MHAAGAVGDGGVAVVTVLPMGEEAVLVEVGSLEAALAVHAGLASDPPRGVTELVPAARTVLVRFDPERISAAAVRAWVGRTPDRAPEEHGGIEVTVDVVYDGPDLAGTADLLGTAPQTLVARHSGAVWRVAFTGFAPGFAYLVSAGWPHDVPRLDTPRTRVPPGSIGLAAGFTGAYPRATPGGWRLIGATAAVLFDPGSPDPVLLAPGATVRFRAARPSVGALSTSADAAAGPDTGDPDPRSAPDPASAPGPTSPPDPTSAPRLGRPFPLGAGTPRPEGAGAPQAPAEALPAGQRRPPAGLGAGTPRPEGKGAPPSPAGAPHSPPGTPPADAPASGTAGSGPAADGGFAVRAPGLLTTVQDAGRPGMARLGIAVSGALDRGALRIANRLVGNPAGAAGVEVTMGGFVAVAGADTWIAVAGAWGPIRVGDRPVDPYRAVRWLRGETLEVGWLVRGARAYLALRGGVAVPAAAGSRATDVLAGLGPAPLRAGDVVPLGPPPDDPVPSLDIAPWGPPLDAIEVGVTPGPRAEWFAGDGLGRLLAGPWTVGTDADRVGVRLVGPPLVRARAGELPSEGMVPGAIQVPPSGAPTVLLADAPVTGGYPVVAVVAAGSLDALAQARPGTRIRFRRA